jgi:hypothetical protein
MTKRGVVYMMMGTCHMARLTVSLFSLRSFYQGEVSVLTSDDSTRETVEKICSDPNIEARSVPFNPVWLKRNSHYATKTMVHKVTPYEENVYLDADTLPLSPFEDVWPKKNEIVLTKFANWTTTGNIMTGRIKKWEGVVPDLTSRMLANPYPALNTGVFGFRKSDPVMDAWHALTMRNPIFIADEIAMQLLYPDYPHRLLDDRYNCSPLFGENKDKVVVWHFHGNKHLREEARTLWLPVFKQCWDKNIADIRGWAPANDKPLTSYMAELRTKL